MRGINGTVLQWYPLSRGPDPRNGCCSGPDNQIRGAGEGERVLHRSSPRIMIVGIAWLAAALLGSSTSAVAAEPGTASPAARSTIELAGPYRSDGRFLRDRHGRVVFFHGVNAVWKRAPYSPPSALFGEPLASSAFDERDAKFLAGNGLNAVRLGVLWAGVEPRVNQVDAAYLGRMRAIAAMLGEHDVGVLVDSHQDQYSEAYQGEGFPDWTRLDRGSRVTNCCHFPLNYMTPSSAAVWNDFWMNRAQLWTRFRNQWMHVALSMRDLPNLVGYDLINEPWPGSSWRRCVLPGGCRNFDSRRLQPMQEHVASEIRALDRTTPIWWEGSTLTAFGNRNEVGAERRLAVPGGNTVLSYHSYCMLGGSLPFLSQGQDPTCMATHRRTFANARRAALRNGSAAAITEFGSSDELVDVARVTTLADANMQSWFYWHYGAWNDPTGAPHVQGLFGDDMDRPGSLKAEKADALVRTYPQAVAGIPVQFGFAPTRADRRFTMTYVPDLRIAQETVVHVPARHYPSGYDVYVTGPARVTSAPDATLLTLDSTGARGAVRLVVQRRGAPRT